MPDILEVLLHLKIKEVDLDQEKENKNKQKKIMSHKQNVLTLSKKEKKVKLNVYLPSFDLIIYSFCGIKYFSVKRDYKS